MRPLNKTLMVVVTAALLALVVGGTVLVPAEGAFPRRLSEWGPTEWTRMTPREQWFYVHGYVMGTYGLYDPLAFLIDRRPGPTGDQLTEVVLTFRRLFEPPADVLLQQISDYYRQGGRAPLVVAPLLAADAAPDTRSYQ